MLSAYRISPENDRRLRRSTVWSAVFVGLSWSGLLVWSWLWLFAPAPVDRLPSQSTPTVMGWVWVPPVMAAFYLVRQLKTTRRVELYNRGLLIVQVSGEKNLTYQEIARVELLDDSAESSKRRLMLSLKDARGKELARIKDSLDNFEQLVRELRWCVGAVRGQAVDVNADDRSARLRQRAARGRKNVFSGAFLLLLGLLATTITVADYRLDRRLRTEGVTAEARVTSHYLYNNRAYRLEYEFTAADGRTYTRDIMLAWVDWDKFTEDGPISIRYLADDPEASLVSLEDEKELGLVLFGGLIMLLIGGGGLALGLIGGDLEYINGKFIFVRRGELMEDKLAR